MNPNLRDTEVLTQNRWSEEQVKDFIRKGRAANKPLLRPAGFPHAMDIGQFGVSTDELAVATLHDGSLTQRSERARYARVDKEGQFAYSEIGKGRALHMLNNALPPMKAKTESELQQGLAFYFHSHPLPIVFSPTDLLLLKLPPSFAPISISVAGGDLKCVVFRSADTLPMISDQEIDRLGDSNFLLGAIRTVQLFKKFADQLPEYVKSQLTQGELFVLEQMEKDPEAFWCKTENQQSASYVYDRFLRDEARRSGLVIYTGKVGDQAVIRHDLDQPIHPFHPKN